MKIKERIVIERRYPMAANNPFQQASPASLVDVREVQIDPTLSSAERIRAFVEQIKNPYLFKVGDTVVHVSYADTEQTLNDNFASMIAVM